MKQERKVEESLKNTQGKVLNPSGLRSSHYPCKPQVSHQFACITRSCINYAFLCANKSCLCLKSHNDCLVIKAQCITSNLQKRIISWKAIEDCIGQTVDKAIDSLSDQRDKLILNIKENFECFGLTEWQKQIYKALTNKSSSDITGHELWQLQLSFKSLKINKQILKEHSLQVKKILVQIQQSAECVFDRVKQYWDEMKLKTQKHLAKRQQILKQAHLQIQQVQEYKSVTEYVRIFKLSKVVNFSDIHRIRNMFKPNQIRQTKLLYRASDNSFFASSFHQKCDSINNTIVFCINQFGKKIGGFSCLTWNSDDPRVSNSKKDQKGSCFVFSLTNNDQFTLINNQMAMLCDPNSGPCFGSDFRIANKAKDNKSSAKISKDYNNSNYKADNPSSYKNFSGSQSGTFFIKEWEVWYLDLN